MILGGDPESRSIGRGVAQLAGPDGPLTTVAENVSIGNIEEAQKVRATPIFDNDPWSIDHKE